MSNGLGTSDTTIKAIIAGKSPYGLSAVASSTTVALVWQGNGFNETGFEIHRSVNGGGYSLYTSLPPNSPNFTDRGVSSNTDYGYKTRSTTDQAVSDFTNETTVHTGSTSIPDWNTYSSNFNIPNNLNEKQGRVSDSDLPKSITLPKP